MYKYIIFIETINVTNTYTVKILHYSLRNIKLNIKRNKYFKLIIIVEKIKRLRRYREIDEKLKIVKRLII